MSLSKELHKPSVSLRTVRPQQRQCSMGRSESKHLHQYCILWFVLASSKCSILMKKSEFNFETSSEKLVERSFLFVPPLLVGDNERPSGSSQKIELPLAHSAPASSARFTLPRARDHISPGPGRIELSEVALKYHWMLFSVGTATTHRRWWETNQWRPKNRVLTIESSCCFFSKIHTDPIQRPYLTWTCSGLTFQGRSEKSHWNFFSVGTSDTHR